MWGRGAGKAYCAVVTAVKKQSVTVQFDTDRTLARVPLSRVTPMPTAQGLPDWMGEGSRVEAVDPLAKGRPVVWYRAELLEARQGPSGSGDDGSRLWVRYETSNLCQWVRRKHVRERGAVSDLGDAAAAEAEPRKPQPRARKTPMMQLTVERISSTAVLAGRELWLLLNAVGAKKAPNCSFEVSFGGHTSHASLIAPSLLACLVPSTVPPGTSPVRVSALSPDGELRVDLACPYMIEVLAPPATAV